MCDAHEIGFDKKTATSASKRAKSDMRKVLQNLLEFDNTSLEQTVVYCSGILTLATKNL